MSVRKLTTKLTMLLALIVGGANANAYAGDPQLPPADPFEFDPDFQWFEPIYGADMLDMKPAKRAHTGWYATYDRLALYGKRPDSVNKLGDENKLDKGAGHRYDLGYMDPDGEAGYLFSYTDYEVGAFDGFRIDRINRLNDENLDGEPTFALGATRFGLPVFPEDGNVFGFSRRFYDVGQFNNMDLDSYEFMKTWRMEPYHYGGILEPMLGVRFLRAQDMSLSRTYGRTREVGSDVPTVNDAYFEDLLENTDAIERLTDRVSEVDNELYTVQFGFRYFKFQNRFRYSAEFRGFTGLNLQCLRQQQAITTTTYDGFDIGSDVTQNLVTKDIATYHTNEEFFIGYEVRAEMSYQLTKMFHVRCGVELIDLALGLWRNDRSLGFREQGDYVDSGENREQSFLAVGGTFGIEMNR